MRLMHKDFEFSFEFKENKQGLLVVESPRLLREFIQSFKEGEEGRFVLSDNNTLLDIKKNVAFIIDYFNISLNERKIITKLNEIIKEEVLNSELFLECNELCQELENFSEKICQNIDYILDYNKKIDTGSLLKFLNFQFQEEQVDIIEQIVDYLKINAELLGVRLFVFVNLMSYFEKYEVDKILEYANYQKINVLLLENKLIKEREGFSEIYVIDEDCCQICLNEI